MSWTRRKIILWTCPLFILLRLPSLCLPFFSLDEAEYSVAGAVIRSGGTMYRDVLIHHPPAIYYFYAFIFTLFGDWNLFAVHLAFLLVVLVSAILLFLVSEETDFKQHFPWSVILFGLGMHAFWSKDTQAANVEILLNLFLIAVFFSIKIAKKREEIGYFAAAGFLYGLALLTKQQAIFFLPALAWMVGKNLRSGCWCLLGFGLLILPLGIYGYGQGMLSEVLMAMGTQSLLYAFAPLQIMVAQSSAITSGIFQELAYYLCKFLIRAIIFMGCTWPLWWGAWKSRKKFHDAILPLWFFGQVLGLCFGGRFFWHYYLLLIPPLVLMALPAFAAPRKLKSVYYVWGTLPLLIWQVQAWTSSGYAGDPYYQQAVLRVQQWTQKEDRIFVWGFMPHLYLGARRLPASRFIQSDPLSGLTRGTSGQLHPEASLIQRLWADHGGFIPPHAGRFRKTMLSHSAWRSFWDDMNQHPPKLIVDTSAYSSFGYQGLPVTTEPSLKNWLSENYQVVGKEHNFVFYLQK